MNHLYEHHLSIPPKQSFEDITKIIEADIRKSNVKEGIAIVYCPHTTAGITINENADPDVQKDLLYGFEKVYPTLDMTYTHYEGNSHAHLKSSTIGASEHLIITGGKLILGTWQSIYFCEFDGPRRRTFYVKIMQG